jgi:hypothetical protein
MALACAVDPLAFKVGLPPHWTPDSPAAAPLVLAPDDGELLSLPQPASSSAAAARTLTATPDRLSFT